MHQLSQNEQVAKILVEAVEDAIHQGQATGGNRSPQAAPRVDPVAAYNSAKNAFADVKKVVRVVQILFFLLILAFFALVFLSHLK